MVVFNRLDKVDDLGRKCESLGVKFAKYILYPVGLKLAEESIPL